MNTLRACRRILLTGCLLSLVVACSKKTPPQPVTLTGASLSEPSPATTAPPAPSSPNAAASAAMSSVIRNVEGATPCERGYNGQKALLEAFGNQQKMVSSKAKFIGECKRLPKDMQDCVDFAYLETHKTECGIVAASLPPATRARWTKTTATTANKDFKGASSCGTSKDFLECKACCKAANSGGFNYDGAKNACSCN